MKFMFDALESSFIVSFFLTILVSPQNTGAIFFAFFTRMGRGARDTREAGRKIERTPVLCRLKSNEIDVLHFQKH